MNAKKILGMTPEKRREYAGHLSKGQKREMLKILNSQCKPGQKICSRCFEFLPLSRFYEDRKAPDEHAYWCADCMSSYRKKPKMNLALKVVKKFLMPHAIRIKTNDNSIIGVYKQRNLASDLPKVLGNDFTTELVPHNEYIELKIKI